MSNRGGRSRGYRRRQRIREDKSRSMGADCVHDGAPAGDVAFERAEGLGKRPLQEVDAPQQAIPLGDARAASPYMPTA
jgi:hypothetical protein